MEAAAALGLTAEELRAEAQQCRAEADELRDRAVRLRSRALKLEREADAQATAPTLRAVMEEQTEPASAPAVKPERRELADNLYEWLRRQRTPKSSTDMAEHFASTGDRVRNALSLLIDEGRVEKRGLKRGTRYVALRDGQEASAPVPFGQRWHERVRDQAIELGTFTLAEIEATMPDLSHQTVQRWVRKLVTDGVLAEARVGNRKVYAYEAPTPGTFHAPSRVERGPARRSRGSVALGGPTRSGGARGREVRALVREAERQGASTRQQKHGVGIVVDGKVVTSVPNTPSDVRSLKNARAAIRRAGIEV